MIEARGKERGTPTVVNTWGEMKPSRCVLASSMDDSLRNPVKFHTFFVSFLVISFSLMLIKLAVR